MPDHFQWQAEYAIGDPEIDAQHRMLFELANRIVTIMDPRKNFSELKASLQSLFDYIDVHFDAEEQLMEEWNYPELENHRLLHDGIRKDMVLLLKDAKDLDQLKKDLDMIINSWVLVHIRNEDAKVGVFRQKQQGSGYA
ncbi:hemerythrin [Desulfobotulus alkaliphilus]|uniref:Hemerythrin n=1 Tax=Desulfobotulus alkaliphilus TaxID=622671 RepID=A0A562RQ63_9BACT|nr:hemerythrin family protein [Desulfobotulus alkaliphilus]TWI71162.1 hemerythrin [Desulfobotulus alkaliphilus]